MPQGIGAPVFRLPAGIGAPVCRPASLPAGERNRSRESPVFRPASLPAGARNSHRHSPHAAAGNRSAGPRHRSPQGSETPIASPRMAQQGIGAPVFRPASLPAGERNSHRHSPHGAAGNRSAGLQTGIAPRRGAKLPSPVPACRSRERGWRNATHASPRCFAVPGQARFFRMAAVSRPLAAMPV